MNVTAATTAPSSRLLTVARDIKLHHSLFALPFALLATFLAAYAGPARPAGWPVADLALIVACMVLARTMAMAFNRWADARLDALNPRTQGRAIPSGRLPAGFMALVVAVCALGFIAVTSGFWFVARNPWPLALSPLALFWLAGYSYTKRFTWLSHLWLGVALALGSLGAAVAIRPAFLARPEPYLLTLLVTFWVAGFDIIYALQDVTIDRQLGLYSMPARLGVGPALGISRALHALSIAALAALWWCSPALGVGFAAGSAIVAGLLVLEHALVWRSATHHINVAFFTLNGIISVVLGGLGVWDVLRAS